jgi:Flp pilus assembly protein TadG
MLLIALASTFLIGLAGLAVDLVLVYAVKTFLATAADSAAMGGVRALERGVTCMDQQSEVDRVTNMLFDANFPDGLLLTGDTGRLARQGWASRGSLTVLIPARRAPESFRKPPIRCAAKSCA